MDLISSNFSLFSGFDPTSIYVLNNSLKIHEENTKKITAVSVVLYVIKFHVNLHKF